MDRRLQHLREGLNLEAGTIYTLRRHHLEVGSNRIAGIGECQWRCICCGCNLLQLIPNCLTRCIRVFPDRLLLQDMLHFIRDLRSPAITSGAGGVGGR